MHILRLTFIAALIALAAAGGVFLLGRVTAPPNPWRHLGVVSSWHRHPGKAPLADARYTAMFRGQPVTLALTPGSHRGFYLMAEDTDGDGLPEIIMNDNRHRRVIAFRPAKADRPPEFVTLSSTGPE